MKIGFHVMGRRGLHLLERALRSAHGETVAYVCVAPDQRVQADHHEEIRGTASQRGIPCFDRKELLPEVDLRMAVAWRWLLPSGPTDLIVFHDSLLPRYRGFCPTVSALINGEKSLGVSALIGGPAYDRGPLLAQAATPITYPCTIAQAMDKLLNCYEQAYDDVVRQARIGHWKTRAQDESEATYSVWRDEDDYAIDWHQDAARLRRFVDATGYPFGGATTSVDGHAYRVLAATDLPGVHIENPVPGKVFELDAGRPVIICGSGLLRIETLIENSTGKSSLPWSKLRSRFR